jgi:hypothetical protein
VWWLKEEPWIELRLRRVQAGHTESHHLKWGKNSAMPASSQTMMIPFGVIQIYSWGSTLSALQLLNFRLCSRLPGDTPREFSPFSAEQSLTPCAPVG